ncbi:MAG: 2-amino-4-hydroxy-6-hydroxymethyldihydropteridine diphosphokinase [Candidatus Omnitrophica bacterium]|nr:2-amino-4-hydroxy-6-hydroxymethyldihydropteridine diphosphokinase [Candidatus Omnitrophota bacterium]
MPEEKKTVFIGMGSNLGDRKANIEKALALVNLIKGVKLLRVSSIYETEPQGGPPQGNFLNGVFEVKTARSPFKLLDELQKIEKHLGRKRRVKNGPRTIDLDILTFADRKVNAKNLKIPHPRMHKREFVLRGIRELRGLK